MSATPPQRESSKTALGVAALRAVHQLLDGEPKILDDSVVGRLLEPHLLQQMQSRGSKAVETAKELRSHIVLRSRFAEDRMALAVARGIRQCVMLGAGLDTFAYRQPGWAHSVRIFEVDHPASQDDKRRRLQAAGIGIPSNLEFVSIDFEAISLREGLQASALNFSEPTFFSCLGVLVYLTPDAAQAVFRLVASFPASSEIVFTFTAPDRSLSPLADKVSALGEPWLTHFEPQMLRRDLLAMGYSSIRFLSPEETEQTYFQGRTDGLPAPRRRAIAAAVVG